MTRVYDDALRGKVIADLLGGASISATAKVHGVPKGTVSGWWKKWQLEEKKPVGAPTMEDSAVVARLQQKLLRYVEANMDALIAQVELFGDKDWLRSQSATELGTLHGILTDKFIRVAERFGGNGTPAAIPLADPSVTAFPLGLDAPAGDPIPAESSHAGGN